MSLNPYWDVAYCRAMSYGELPDILNWAKKG